jgi:hypothetical protein
MPIMEIYFQLTQQVNVGIGFPFHKQSLHHTSRFFFRNFLLHIRTKAAKARASLSEFNIVQVQTGAYSSVLVPCDGEGTLCILVQKDWSCKLVKLAVTCIATISSMWRYLLLYCLTTITQYHDSTDLLLYCLTTITHYHHDSTDLLLYCLTTTTQFHHDSADLLLYCLTTITQYHHYSTDLLLYCLTTIIQCHHYSTDLLLYSLTTITQCHHDSTDLLLYCLTTITQYHHDSTARYRENISLFLVVERWTTINT